MNTAPWWLAIATAGLTGILTISASMLTVMQTNKQASRRQAKELEHQKEVERRKLLHEHRTRVYSNVVRECTEIHALFRQLPFTARHSSNSFPQAINAVIEARPLGTAIDNFNGELQLFASPLLISTYGIWVAGASEATAAMANYDRSRTNENLERLVDSIDRLQDHLLALINSMRIDLGVTEPSVDGLARALELSADHVDFMATQLREE